MTLRIHHMSEAALYHGHSDKVFSVAWSPNGKYLASGSRDHTVRVWDTTTGNCVLVYRGHESHVLSVAWSPASTRVASGCTDGIIHIWDAASGETLVTYHGHSRFVRG